MVQVAGRFHDGMTAAEHEVQVTASAEGLDIAGKSVKVFWRRADLSMADQSLTQWRIANRPTPDARLKLERTAAAEQALRLSGALDEDRDMRRGILLGVGLVGLAALIVVVIFVLIPMAAGPLARATPRDFEAQMGRNMAAQYQLVLRPCKNAEQAYTAIDPLLTRLEGAAEPGFDIELTFVRTDVPQAMALPGGQIMVTEGLLDISKSPDELAAVIAHEIGHVKNRDGMVALYRYAGFGILLEAFTGGTGAAQQAVVLGGQLAELSYSRRQEEHADRTAISALNRASLNPGALADAFENLKESALERRAKLRGEKADADSAHSELPDWFMSHPATEARIEQARRAERTPAGPPALSPEAWETVRNTCKTRQ